MPLPTRDKTVCTVAWGQVPIPLIRGPQQAPWLHSWVGRAAPQPAPAPAPGEAEGR